MSAPFPAGDGGVSAAEAAAGGVSVFQPDPLAMERVREEQQQQQQLDDDEHEQEEADRIERELELKMAGNSFCVETESDTDDEGGVGVGGVPLDQATPQNRLGPTPYQQQLTSTPFVPHLDLEEGSLNEETPQRERNGGGGVGVAGRREDDEQRYLQATGHNEQLEILYQARGHEIARLKEDAQKVQDAHALSERRLRHELALLRAEAEEAAVKQEQRESVMRSALEENRELRQQVELLEQAKQKTNKDREDLLARAESSDHLVQTLQQQLIELQKKDTLVRAREHHDTVVRSLKDRHDSELASLQQEVDRQTDLARRATRDADVLRQRLDETQLRHETMLVEKSERVEELSQKLDEARKRMSDLAAAKGEDAAAVEEICQLNARLAELTHENGELAKCIHDLKDELSQYESERNEKVSTQTQLLNLRHDLEEKRRQERDLLAKCTRMKADMTKLQEELRRMEAKQRRADEVLANQRRADEVQANQRRADEVLANKKAAEDLSEEVTTLRQESANLRQELKAKQDHMDQQEKKLAEIIALWEKETEQIKQNHGKDRRELLEERQRLEEVRAKYADLKKRVRKYQLHARSKDEHHKQEMQNMQDNFGQVLVQYKAKVEEAYQSKERMVEDEIYDLKHRFEQELQRIVDMQQQVGDADADGNADDVPASAQERPHRHLLLPPRRRHHHHHQQHHHGRLPSHSVSNSASSVESGPASDDGGGGGGGDRPRSVTSSEQLARIFANATKDIRHQLKRPDQAASAASAAPETRQ